MNVFAQIGVTHTNGYEVFSTVGNWNAAAGEMQREQERESMRGGLHLANGMADISRTSLAGAAAQSEHSAYFRGVRVR